MKFGLVYYKEILFLSALISRKLFRGFVYSIKFRSFAIALNNEIETADDFKKVWDAYCRDFERDNKMKEDIGVKYYILKMIYEKLLDPLTIKRNHEFSDNKCKEIDKRKNDREDIIFTKFIYIICNFVSFYEEKKYKSNFNKYIEKPLKDINFELFLIKIIKDCYNSEEFGFLSTLALMKCVMIYLRLTEEKKKLISNFFRDINYIDIGWLNRRMLEVAIATVMIECLPDKKLGELQKEFKCMITENSASKSNFRDMLGEKLKHMNLYSSSYEAWQT